MPQSPYLTAEALLSPRLEQRILPGLERVHAALAAFGQPQRSFRSVLVLGTNGKGSTAALLASVLSAAGLRVGLYTSPHVVHVGERIQIDGVNITAPRLQEVITSLEPFSALSYFETLTVAAFVEFAAQRVEVAVVEAGLGGRWDAAATCEPVVSVLTNVGTDHQRWLGTTRAEIAAEKAAALRGQIAIIGEWDAEVEPAIRREASAPLTLVHDWARVEPLGQKGETDQVEIAVGPVSGQVTLPLVGAHQHRNAALALAGAAALAHAGVIPFPSLQSIAAGFAAVSWPGRWQWLESQHHRLLLDGAHNREAMVALAACLDAHRLSGAINLVFSCLNDKPVGDMAKLLNPRVCNVVVVPLESPRATDLDTLALAFPGCSAAPSPAAAIALLAPDSAPILVTGSLRLVGEVLASAGERHG